MHLFAITIGNHSPNRMDFVPNKSSITKKKRWTHGQTDRWMDVWGTDRWMYKQMDVQIDLMDKWADGQKDGRTDRYTG